MYKVSLGLDTSENWEKDLLIPYLSTNPITNYRMTSANWKLIVFNLNFDRSRSHFPSIQTRSLTDSRK